MAEAILEKLKTWLSTYPGWEAFSLIPREIAETSRHTDLVGNSRIECKYYVNLYWQLPSLGDEAENACRLLEFQNWVREQCVMCHIPQLGDVSAWDWIHTEKGGFALGAQSVSYTVTR